jgi:hypothetical protein
MCPGDVTASMDDRRGADPLGTESRRTDAQDGDARKTGATESRGRNGDSGGSGLSRRAALGRLGALGGLAVAGCSTPVSAVRAGRWKLHRFYEGRRELYDLRTDVDESDNRAADRPAVRDRLSDRRSSWIEETGAQLPEPN